MNSLYLGLKLAISYFTIFPIKFKKNVDLSKKEVLDAMVLFFPLTGFILGLVTVIIYSFLDSTPWLGAIISSCIYMVLYGFLHTEAILDVVDAIYAKHSGKDPYKVIKDPRIGAMGLLYSLVFVALKITALTYLLISNLLLEFLSIVVISRMCLQFIIYFFDFRSSYITQLKN